MAWSVGIPQWSADGTRLLHADGDHLYLTDAVTGDSRRINLQGGCEVCSYPVWLPGETEVAIPLSRNQTDALQVYSVETGAKLRQVPWSQTRMHGFSPDGRYVVAKLEGRSAIVEVATGRRVATIDVDDTRAAYWVGPDAVLVVADGGADAYSLQGLRIQRYEWPRGLSGDDLAEFTLVRGD